MLEIKHFRFCLQGYRAPVDAVSTFRVRSTKASIQQMFFPSRETAAFTWDADLLGKETCWRTGLTKPVRHC